VKQVACWQSNGLPVRAVADSFDAAIMIGQHAKTNTDGGHYVITVRFLLRI